MTKAKYFEINENGHNIRCKVYGTEFRDVKRVVIFTTGFGGHKDNKAAERFAEFILAKYKHINTVTFNWPCHGDDVKKKLTLADCMTYLDMVLSEVKTRFGAEEIYLYGTSFGGFSALKYIADHGDPFKKMALRCPAIPMHETLKNSIIKHDEWELLQKGQEVQVGFDRKVPVTKAFLDDIEAGDVRQYDYLDYADDILIMHGTADKVVPIGPVQAFAEKNVIECVPIEGADHRFMDHLKMDEAIKLIVDFFGFSGKH